MRTRKAYRLPEWAINAIKAIANGYEVTETEALLRIIDQGHKWHLKNIYRIKETLSNLNASDNNESSTNTGQTNYKQSDEDIEEMMQIAKIKWVDD